MSKTRPIIFSTESVRAILKGKKTQTRRVMKSPPEPIGLVAPKEIVCPFGTMGDRLWVKETFWRGRGGSSIIYEGDTAETLLKYENPAFKKVSALFMPRKFSRLTLEIVNVGYERLQDITWNDCIKEGTFQFHGYIDEHGIRSEGKRLFAEMWDKINGKKHPWESNPFCWVIEFKRIEGKTEPRA